MLKIRLGVRVKLGLVFAAVVTVLALGMGTYAYFTMKEKIIASSEEKLKSDLQLGSRLLDSRYPGEWTIQQGQLYKGNVLMEGNNSIVDEIGSLTEDSVTIFRGNTRVSTNVMKDGVRQVNTQAATTVQEVVLRQGKTYLGEADVVGVRNLTAYEPIRNAQNEVIGMWFVGVPTTPYEEMANNFRNNLILFGIFGYLLTMSAAGFYATIISRRILHVAEAMQKAEGGDLTTVANLSIQDELGQLANSFNHMMANLQHLVNEVRQVAEKVNLSAEDLNTQANQSTQALGLMSNSLQSVTESTLNQSGQVDQTASMIERMSQGIEQVAHNSVLASGASIKAAQVAEEGGDLIKQAVGQMNVIDQTVNDSAQKVLLLGEKSQQIGQIVDVITGIAGQTNLLALNAAIEAARAGEQGRGFAVVADEVRKLAEQSEGAAKQIADLIFEIQSETQTAVQAMSQGTHEVKSGLHAVASAGQAFTDIIQAIENVTNQIEEVTAANQEMAVNSQEVTQAAGGIRDLALSCAGGAREVSTTAENQLYTAQRVADSAAELAQASQVLQEAVKQFKVE
ncbi:MAG: methyl-accepting chemotaxis protein [Syntrophomonadaceae bacterium]|nr:methyl-accepting chemotaxis protein [Syntrophomonadaceae bacterium]